ncbi:hypothetical protein F4814DRAFT_457770 [Daldinia grandis]|nr:hypothetical protein F4814DRAFT_457770 [Daldinia grandis]
MDVLAAVGLVSNVLQFVSVGYRVLSASRDMYGVGNGSSQSNKDVEFITREMRRLSLSLEKEFPTLWITDEEEALQRLVTECRRWSNDMLALLGRLRNGNPNSRFEAFRAALRSHRMRHERDRLERGLDSCRKQLHLQIARMSRSDINKGLRELVASANSTNQDLTNIRDAIESFRQLLPGQVANIDSQFLERLQDGLRLSDEALLASKRKLLLDALKYEGMEDRFYYVELAHATTLEWILKDDPGHDNASAGGLIDRKMGRSNQQLANFRKTVRERFTSWLRNGNGIFHISGKPGAGKSTLMKFLCMNQLTKRHLEHWANGKVLVFAKTFFWRLGSDTQKSLIGLIRSLLYEVLSTAPELIPVAFASLWAQSNSYRNGGVRLELSEIEHAFKTLLTSEATFKKHKLVFFVDGLDEYQGRHVELVNKLTSWASLNAENLKICVSSREWNEFMVGFSECPQLRIHDCTHQDITTFVSDRLEDVSHFPTLVDREDMRSIVEKIVNKAEGVFLWVRLVLTSVEDGILNGDDPSDLKSKVDTFPSELKALYQHLFDSIHYTDRPKVFEALRMVRITQEMRYKCKLLLLRFFFLNKVIDDQNYAMEMDIGYMSDRDITRILKITRRQIYGRCKGLLDICPINIPQGNFPHSPLPDDGEVTFMHSTAYEFLEEDPIKETIDHVVGHVDFFDRSCQTFLAFTKFAEQAWYFYGGEKYSSPFFDYELGSTLRFATFKTPVFLSDGGTRQRHDRFLEFLTELEIVTAVRLKSKPIWNRASIGVTMGCNGVSFYSGHTQPDTHVQTFAICWQLHEFIRRSDPSYLMSTVSKIALTSDDVTTEFMSLLMGEIGYHTSPMGLCYTRQFKMLELCFSRGISPNYIGPKLEGPLQFGFQGLSLFELILQTYIFRHGYVIRYDRQDLPPEPFINPLRLLELCLRYGARVQFRLCFGPVSRDKRNGEVVLKVRAEYTSILDDSSSWGVVPRSCPLTAFAEERNWEVTLRDLVELWFPQDYKTLQHLIDRNQNMTNLDLHLLSPEVPTFSQEELARPWSTVELGGNIFPWRSNDKQEQGNYEVISNL